MAELERSEGQLAATRVELTRLSKQNQTMRNTLKQIRLMAFVMAALLTALLVVLHQCQHQMTVRWEHCFHQARRRWLRHRRVFHFHSLGRPALALAAG